ncbi:MAG: VWA domain-containing protein [Pyrinomonadaceae bacterium]|nr:VWA domain-containing protein [Pyrinomonadaceae bacterium]
MKYLASHNLKLSASEPEQIWLVRHAIARPISAWLLLAAISFASAPAAFAQSGRKTQGTSPTSTQRPRRATTSTSQEKTPASSQQKSGPTISILPDDAPPAPATKPKPAPQAAVKDDDVEVGPEDVLRITSSLVTVPASVVDSYGRAVAGLKVEDFELRVDGQVKAISDISYSDTPVRLALLFDNSSSLTAAREFEKQAAIRFFRSVMRPVDQAAIYNVYTEIELAQPLTSNVTALVRTIENFGKPEGATRLFDAIVQAANYLRPQPGRKVIIIVSDGEDTLSDTSFDETLRIAQAADCQIYAVQTKQIEYMMQTGQPGGSANLRSLAAERRLQEFSAQTGGAVYSPLAVGELDAAFAQISADLAQQYILSYYPVDDKQDGRYRSISLRVLTNPNARVRARKGYYASRSAMKSSINWQTNPSGGANVASINASDTVPNDAGRQSVPISSSTTASLTPAPEIKVASTQPATSLPPPSEPPPPVTSEALPRATSPTSTAQNAQPSSSTQTSQPTQSQASESPAIVTSTTPVASAPSTKQVSGGVLNGRALSLPKPDYPATARAVGASGLVVIEVTVDETGKVIAARLVSGHPMLKAAAIAAAKQARFAPTKLSGQPVRVTGTINYNFALAR